MRKNLVKTITSTTIYTKEVTVESNGNITSIELKPITVTGRIEKDKAHKVAKRFYKDVATLVVTGVEYDETRYTMSLEKFIANADIMEDSLIDGEVDCEVNE